MGTWGGTFLARNGKFWIFLRGELTLDDTMSAFLIFSLGPPKKQQLVPAVPSVFSIFGRGPPKNLQLVPAVLSAFSIFSRGPHNNQQLVPAVLSVFSIFSRGPPNNQQFFQFSVGDNHNFQ